MESCLQCSEENGEKTESGIMKLPAYYTCPACHPVAVIRYALNDAPDEWPITEGIFARCVDCVRDGGCVLRYEVRV